MLFLFTRQKTEKNYYLKSIFFKKYLIPPNKQTITNKKDQPFS